MDGEPVVHLEEAYVKNKTDKWKCILIAYFIGKFSWYNAMIRYRSHNWSNVAKLDLYLHEDGYYIIKFGTIENVHKILYVSPYIINNKLMILEPWTMHFDLSIEFMVEMPLYVKFSKLPLNCWNCGSLSRIASAIGSLYLLMKV